jgi:hypothetical protein
MQNKTDVDHWELLRYLNIVGFSSLWVSLARLTVGLLPMSGRLLPRALGKPSTNIQMCRSTCQLDVGPWMFLRLETQLV